jgi:hypothetical protein
MVEWSRYFKGDSSFEISKWVFDNIRIWDAHCHLGSDKDGMRLSAKELVKRMNAMNVEKAIVFPFNDPRRQKCFEIANDDIYKAWKDYPNRLIPFFRLNPNENCIGEIEKRVSQGFSGIKLHPRSQNFDLNAPNAMKIYEMAEDAGIPVLIHTGYGLLDVADKISRIVKTYKKLKLILGHSAFVDIENILKKASKPKVYKNVYFDVSTVKIFDLYDVLQNTKKSNIVYGSDMPYTDMEYSLEALIHMGVVLDVPLKDMEKILGKNLIRWFS